MRRWHAETVSGNVQELERKLNEVEAKDGQLVGVTSFSGQYPSWTVIWSKYVQDDGAEVPAWVQK